jgi:hypothetical protein
MSLSRLNESYDLILPVGDLHIHKDEVDEGKRFIKWLVEGVKILQKNAGKKVLIVFMGDQHNDFAVMRVEVSEFWSWAYDYIKQELGHESVSLTGNHDMNQDETASAMTSHSSRTEVISRQPVFLNKSTAAVGFMRKEDLFYTKVMEAYTSGARTIYCHAEFEGSQYENGFYAPHGFNLARYPADLKFVSGHIHLKQEFGAVFYVGSPRQLTRSDLGEVKGIHVIDYSQAGARTFIETPPDVCVPFREIVIEENGPEVDLTSIPANGRVYIHIKGSKEFARKIAKSIPDGPRIRSSYTDEVKSFNVKESEGIPSTFNRFAEDYFKTNNVPDHMKTAVLKKIYDACPSLKLGVR